VKHVDAARIGQGRAAYQRERPRLRGSSAETGVPESIMVAIWGHETNYGRVMGGFDLPRALASLAYEGRRRDLFASEFIATLKMIDRGVPREKLVGSWAGAFGGPQFLPSVYLRLARGRRRRRHGRYLERARRTRSPRSPITSSMPAGARVSPGASRCACPTNSTGRRSPNDVAPRCPRVSRPAQPLEDDRRVARAGIMIAGPPWPADNVQATLLEPDGPGQDRLSAHRQLSRDPRL
jgi:membrane-bound lytic murein transglycosylase B